MKRIYLTSLSVILAFIMMMSTVSAESKKHLEFPDIKYDATQNVEVMWNNMSSIGTLTPGMISFTVKMNANSATSVDYYVLCELDDKKVVNQIVKLPAGNDLEKSFGFSASAGIHDVTISILKQGNAIYEKSEKIYVIKNYERQFMDDTSGRGINTHYGRLPYRTDLEFTTDLINLSGLRIVRDGTEWEFIEKTKGNYDFTNVSIPQEVIRKRDLERYWNVSYGNGWLYLPERDMNPNVGWSAHTHIGHPQTQESIQAYTDFAEEVVDYFDENNYKLAALETWNEPNGSKPNGTEMAQIFTDFVKPIKIKLLRDGKDAEIASFVPHHKNQSEFLNGSMQLGFYPYFDRYAAHEYQSVGGFETSDLYNNRMKKLDDFITEYGGWKRIDLTEAGFTTVGGNTGATLESASHDVVKLYTVCEYNNLDNILLYDLMNDGTDATYSEHQYGLVYYDGILKPGYLTLTNYNNQTSGGIMIGEIETGLPDGTKAFMYYKDGVPVVVAWSNQLDDSAVTWDLGDSNVTVIDNYGNIIAENVNSVTFGEEPVYIKGLSAKYICNAVHHDLIKLNSEWIERYSDMLSESLKGEVTDVFKMAENETIDEVTEQQALELFNKYVDIGHKIIEAGKNGELEEKDVSMLTYRLYRAMEKIAKLYITLYSGAEIEKAENRYNECYEKTKAYYSNISLKQYSDAMLRFAKYYNEDMKIVFNEKENPSKAGILKGYDLMAEAICDWFDALFEYESVTELGLSIQTPYYDRRSYVNNTVTTEVNLNNYTKKDFSGTICAFNEAGEKIGESPFIKVAANGGYTKTSVSVKTSRPTDDTGCVHYYLSYVDEQGNVLYTLRTEYFVTDLCTVSVLPCTETVDNLKNVKMKITNLTPQSQNVHVELESDGSFEFKNTKIDTVLEANEEKIVELSIKSISDTKYHFYSFKYVVKDDNGTIVAENDSVLSFTNIVKTEVPISVEQFDGDISAWENAYPIYINAPSGAGTTEAWANAECSARAFLKWDDERLYLLVDVYDEKYLQPFTGQTMWQGDSIQLALDPNNDKSTSYLDDDFELGFSYTPLGNEFYSWYAPTSLKTGVVDFFNVVRNEDLHFSRYLISLDKSIISNVKLEKGNKMGLNIAINDNDYLQREGFYQFTKGLADVKNPSLYADFNFIETENKNRMEGKAESIFPTKVENSIVSKDMVFSDISGHWSETIVNKMVAEGYIYGMGDGTFAPDKKMTRAEFFAVISRMTGISKENSTYSDVNENDWYANVISNVSSFIPIEMVSINNEIFPDKYINREEAIYIISKVYQKSKSVQDVKSDCRTYPDGNDVSDWAREMINVALDNYLIVGSTDGKLYPKDTLTRAEACSLLNNLILSI